MIEDQKLIEYGAKYDTKKCCIETPKGDTSLEKIYLNYKNFIEEKTTMRLEKVGPNSSNPGENIDEKSDKKPEVKKEVKYFTDQGIVYILHDKKYFPFEETYYMKLIFPDGITKNIFIPRNNCIIDILDAYANYDYKVKKDKENDFKEETVNMNTKYNAIQFFDPSIKENDYARANTFLKLETNSVSLSELSPVFDLYFDDSIIMKSNPTFKFTKKREEFFSFLDNKLNTSTLIPFCGPEGIGKTISILAFFRKKQLKYNYVYCNLKKLYHYFLEKDNKSMSELMIKELYHSNCTFEDLNKKLNDLKKKFEFNLHPIDVLYEIIKLLELNQKNVIILDKYRIKYDDGYVKLQNLYKETLKRKIKIIVISSMNELDVKQSIIYNLKEENEKPKGFFLNYIYITSLVLCEDENDLKLLNEEETKMLEDYGKTYQIFYELIKTKESYKKSDKNDSFESYFDSVIKKNFEDRVNAYFNNEKGDKKMEDKLLYLSKCTKGGLSLKDFIENSQSIPFRFFSFYLNDKNVFEISEIKKEESIILNYQCNKYLEYIGNMYNNEKMKSSKQSFTETNVVNKIAYTFEESFISFLLLKPNIKGVKVIDKKEILSFFNMQKTDINLDNLNNGDAFVITMLQQNAKAFDCGLIVCVNKDAKIFNLYLFQATQKKKSDERFSYMTLNYYINCVKINFTNIYEITIKDVFFSYVFDENSKDRASIEHCKYNNINYILFNMMTFNLSEPFNIKPYATKIKFLEYNEIYELVRDPSKTFIQVSKNLKGTLDHSNNFMLKKKRFIKEIQRLFDEEKKINKTTKKKSNISQKTKKNDSEPKEINLAENDDVNNTIIEIEEKEDICKIFNICKAAENYYAKTYGKKNKKKSFIVKIRLEKLVEDYLIGNSNITLPGITYLNDQNIINEINNNFSQKEWENLNNLIFKEREGSIILFSQIKEFIPQLFIPEYNTFIIFQKSRNISYYIDYVNEKYILLETMEEFSEIYTKPDDKFFVICTVTTKNKNDNITNTSKIEQP